MYLIAYMDGLRKRVAYLQDAEYVEVADITRGVASQYSKEDFTGLFNYSGVGYYVMQLNEVGYKDGKPIDKLKKAIEALEKSQQNYFEPKPGEKPDKNGYYWRTINGRKVRFKKGDLIVDNITDQVPSYRLTDDGKPAERYRFAENNSPDKLFDATKRDADKIVDLIKGDARHMIASTGLKLKFEDVVTKLNWERQDRGDDLYAYYVDADKKKAEFMKDLDEYPEWKKVYEKQQKVIDAFNDEVAEALKMTSHVIRFTGFNDLESLLVKGKFTSKGKFSDEHVSAHIDITETQFDKGDVRLEIPSEYAQAGKYTQLPRLEKDDNEYGLPVKWMMEAEAVIPVGTPAKNLIIIINEAKVPPEDQDAFKKKYSKIGEVKFESSEVIQMEESEESDADLEMEHPEMEWE